MTDIGEVKARLTGDASGAMRAVDQAARSLDRLGKAGEDASKDLAKLHNAISEEIGDALKDLSESGGRVANVFAQMGTAGKVAAAALGLAAGAFYELSKAIGDTINAGGRLADLSAKTSITTDGLQKLQHAGMLVGTSMETITGAVSRMQRAMVEAPDKFQKLGLSTQQLLALKPDQQLNEIAKAVQKIEDPARQAAAAMDVFGKSGAELLPLLKSDMEAAAAEAEHLGLVMGGESVKAADALGDQLDTLGETWKALKRSMAEVVTTSPQVLEVMKGLTGFVGLLNRSFREGVPYIQNYFREIDSWLLGGNLNQLSALAGFAGELGAPGPTVKQNTAFGTSAGGIDFTQIAVNAALAMDEFGKADDRAAAAAKRLAAAQRKANDELQFLLQNGFDIQKFFQTAQGKGPNVAPMGGLKQMPWIETLPQNMPEMMGGQFYGMYAMGTKNIFDGAVVSAKTAKAATADWHKELTQVLQTATQIVQALGLAGGPGAAKGGAIGSAIGGLAGSLIPGIGTAVGAAAGGILGGIFGSIFGHDKAKEQAAQRKKQQDDALAGFKNITDALDQFRRETVQKAGSAVGNMFAYMASQTNLSTERMQRMGAIGFGVFQQMRASGMSFLDALDAIGPALDQALAAAGGDTSKLGPLAGLANLRDLIKQNQELVAYASSFGDIINAARADLSLTQDGLKAFGEDATSIFQDLIAHGFSWQDAIAVMGPTLLAISKAAENLGLDSTAMLDAITGGHGAEAQKQLEGLEDPMQKQLDLLADLNVTLGLMAKLFGVTLPDNIQKLIDKMFNIPKSLETDLTIHEHRTRDGDPGDPDVHAASGFSGMLTRPTRFLAGEAGPEFVSITPAGDMGGGGGFSELLDELRAQRMAITRLERVLPKAMRDSLAQVV